MLFRCKRSGNTINIDQPDDIERMRVHEEYTEVIEQVSTHYQGDQDGLREKEQNAETSETEVKQSHQPKRRGRSAKQVEQVSALEI